MSADLDRVRREVTAAAWSKPDWIPILKVVEWPALVVHRERHEQAARAFAAAKSDAEVEDAIEQLCIATKTAISDLRARIGATYSTASSFGEDQNEFADAYRIAKERADNALEEEKRTPTGWLGIEEWIEKEDPPEHLVEFAKWRVDLSDDVDRWKAFQGVVLYGPTRLLGGQVEPIQASEAIAAREEIDRLRMGATA